MKRPRRRKMHYHASSLHDGTVFAAHPIRKPAPRILKRDGFRIDADGVATEFTRNGQELSDWNNETRFRFQNIIAINLNTRRAIRELVLPQIAAIADEISALRAEVSALREAVAEASQVNGAERATADDRA